MNLGERNQSVGFIPPPAHPPTTTIQTHLQGALQGTERMRFLIDDGVLVAPDERPPEVIVRKRLLLAHQGHASFLDVIQHFAHFVFWGGWKPPRVKFSQH